MYEIDPSTTRSCPALMIIRLLSLSIVFLLVQSQSIQPPAIPLAVRSPYLQAYLGHNTGAAVPNSWPVFWTNHVRCVTLYA